MRRVAKTLLWLMGATALVAELRAAAIEANGDNPYAAIVQRNIFDLKAPDLSNISSPPPAPPLNVKLTGLTTIMGYPQALFMVAEPPGPGKPPNKEESYILVEGERQGALELVKIDLKAGKAQIKNDGVASTIALEVPKAIAPGTVGQGVPGGAPGMLHQGFAQPPIPGGGYGGNPANGSTQPMQTRTPRTTMDGSTGAPYQGGVGQAQTALGGFSGNQTPAQQAAAAAAQQPVLSPIEQITRTEQQKQQLLSEGNPLAGLLPSYPGAPSSQQQSDTGTQQSTPTPAAPASPPLGQRTTGKYNFSR